jgi:N-acetylneuraminic acid mutarotase
VPSPSRSSFAVGRKLALAIFVVALALGLITAATVFGSSQGPRLARGAQPQWQYAPHLLNRRSYTASAEIGGRIYVAAGMVGNSGRPLNLFEVFDPVRNEWSSLPFVPERFSAAAGAALGSTMYVIGGNGDPKDKAVDGRQVFAYDVRTRKWSRRASLPAVRTNLAAVGLGGEIYALGGLDPFHATRSVFVYDPRRNRWRTGPPLPEKLHALAAVRFRGELWVIGGQNAAGKAVSHVWIYNANRHRWRPGPTMPVPLETAGAAATASKIYVVLEKTFLTWDAQTRRWTRGPGLRTPRHALAVFVADGDLYAIGGCIAPILEDSAIVEKLPLSGQA